MKTIPTNDHYQMNFPTNYRLQRIYFFSIIFLITFIITGCAGQPVNALLPMANTVPESTSTEIDGVWKISSLGKRIKIERGRAYAIDSWLHLGLMRIQPNMVVIKDIREDGFNGFSGYDLPLLGNWQATKTADGNLNVTVAGSLGPVSYQLLAVGSDYSDGDDFFEPEEDEEDIGDHPRPVPPMPFPPSPIDPINYVGKTVTQIGKRCYEDFKPMGRAMLKYGACQAGLRNFNMVKTAISKRDENAAIELINAATCQNEFKNMVSVLNSKGFRSISLGVSGDVAVIIGASGEASIASNIDLSKPTFYGTVGAGLGTQAGVGLNGVVSAYYAKADQLSGKGKSFSVSLKAMGGAGGAVGLSSGSSPSCESFSASAGAGAAVNAGSISSTHTFKLPKLDFIHKPDFSASCKDVSVSVKNKTGYDIKIVDIDFYDYVNNRWRSKFTKNTKVKKGRKWSKKLRLQKVGGDKTRVKFQYRVKNKGGVFNKWSKVVSRETSAKKCKAGIKFSKDLK